MEDWYKFSAVETLRTPALVFYRERIEKNIETALAWVDKNPERLRPHIKTFKCYEILLIFKKYGITKVKTATLEEMELAAQAAMPDVLLAYQVSKQKAKDYANLLLNYPQTHFSTLIDNLATAETLNRMAHEQEQCFDFFIDVNVGMNRTGIAISEDVEGFLTQLKNFKNLNFRGFHCYDGHLKDTDWKKRTAECGKNFTILSDILAKQENPKALEIACGGSNTFPYYALQSDAVCCPGTFVLWDYNYSEHLPEQAFLPAALIIAQVVSKPAKNLICVDIGYKAVSSENALTNRLRVLNHPNWIPVSQSEEHFVFQHSDEENIRIGDIIYAMPYHVCPTVALYSKASVVTAGKIDTHWKITGKR